MTEQASLHLLLQQTLLFSAAVLLLALLRPMMRRLLDAGAVYLAWLLVPLMMLSPALPRLLQGQVLPDSVLTLERAVPAWLKTSPAMPESRPGAEAAAPRSAVESADVRPAPPPGLPTAPALALAAWALGALGLLLLLARRQRRFGERLQRQAEAWRAPAGDSPALMGLWQARLVLPQDFERRYSAREQALILAHEAVHARRHDNAWNLLAAGLLVLQWFNPLAWWALRAMRMDQELACDAAVLNQAHPHNPGEEPLVKTYVNALLKSHPQRDLPVLSTGWAHRHPLLERVRQLARPALPAWQRGLGRSGVAALCAGLALLAQAAAPASGAPMPQATGLPPAQALMIEVSSQQGSLPWQQRSLALTLPAEMLRLQTYYGSNLQARQGDWCLGVMLYAFPDGTVRPMAEVLDKSCKKTITGLSELQPGHGPQTLTARLPDAQHQALQAQISVHWTDTQSPEFAAMVQQQRQTPLTEDQRADMQRYADDFRKVREEMTAQDKAWRQSRGEQP